MTSAKKHLRKNGYVFDEEAGVYAVTPQFFDEITRRAGGSDDFDFSVPIGGAPQPVDAPIDELTPINEEEDVTGFLMRQLTNCETILDRYRTRLGHVEQRLHQLEQRSTDAQAATGGVVRGQHDQAGNVGPVGDDESFDSWAGRQIGKLSAILNEEVLDRMARRISRTEERMTRFTMDDDSEFRRLIFKVQGIADTVAFRTKQTDDAIESLKEAYENTHQAFEQKVMEFSARLAAHGVPQTGFIRSEVVMTPGEKKAARDEDGQARYLIDLLHDAAAMREEAYSRGLAAGRSQGSAQSAIAEAARRVEAHMKHLAVSDDWTSAVVRVVRGEEPE